MKATMLWKTGALRNTGFLTYRFAWAASVLGALTLHLFFFASLYPALYSPDSRGWLSTAVALGQHQPVVTVNRFQMPGYGFLIGGLFLLFGETLWLVAALQHLALLTVAYIFLPPARDAPWHSYVPAAFFAFHPGLALLASTITSEVFFIVFVCVGTKKLLLDDRNITEAALGGVLLGLATLFRGNGIVVLAIIVGWRFFTSLNSGTVQQELRRLLIAACCFSIVFLPIPIKRMSDGAGGLLGRSGAGWAWIMETLVSEGKLDIACVEQATENTTANPALIQLFITSVKAANGAPIFMNLETTLAVPYSTGEINDLFKDYIGCAQRKNSLLLPAGFARVLLTSVPVLPPIPMNDYAAGFDFSPSLLTTYTGGTTRPVPEPNTSMDVHILKIQAPRPYLSADRFRLITALVELGRWTDTFLFWLLVYIFCKYWRVGSYSEPAHQATWGLLLVYVFQIALLMAYLRYSYRYSVTVLPLVLLNFLVLRPAPGFTHEHKH